MRELIRDALTADGRPDKAALATDPTAAIMRSPVALPGGAQAVRFDAFPHPGASFYVGVAGNRVFYLTETPSAFSAMTRASGLRVDTPDVAVAVARAYVETTRSMDVFSRVLDGIGDIEWNSGPTAPPVPDRDATIGRLRDVVTAPRAEPSADGYQVTAYVLRGSTLERRTLTVAPDGAVTERTEQVAADLPVTASA